MRFIIVIAPATAPASCSCLLLLPPAPATCSILLTFSAARFYNGLSALAGLTVRRLDGGYRQSRQGDPFHSDVSLASGPIDY